MAAGLRRDIGRQVGPAVVHGQDDAVDRETRVEVVTNEIERGKQLGQSFQGVVLALERDQDGIGGGEGIDGEQSERRRAIDQDVVVSVRDAGELTSQPALPALDGRQLQFGAGKRDGRGHDIEPVDRPVMIRSAIGRPSTTAS